MQIRPTVTQESAPVFDFVTRLSGFAFSHRSMCSSSDGYALATLNSLCFHDLPSLPAQRTRKILASLSLNSKNSADTSFHRFISDFNRFVRFHCNSVPEGFASVGFGLSAEVNGFREDGHGVSGDEGFPLNRVEADRPKKVLILMIDTSGGHRASAEAIKAALNEEFGDDYQVSVLHCFSFTSLLEPAFRIVDMTSSQHGSRSTRYGLEIE